MPTDRLLELAPRRRTGGKPGEAAVTPCRRPGARLRFVVVVPRRSGFSATTSGGAGRPAGRGLARRVAGASQPPARTESRRDSLPSPDPEFGPVTPAGSELGDADTRAHRRPNRWPYAARGEGHPRSPAGSDAHRQPLLAE